MNATDYVEHAKEETKKAVKYQSKARRVCGHLVIALVSKLTVRTVKQTSILVELFCLIQVELIDVLYIFLKIWYLKLGRKHQVIGVLL